MSQNNEGVRTANRPEAEDEIDLMELFRALWSKAWLLAICLIVGAAAAFLGTKLLITPKYQSYSMIYVYTQQNENSTSYSDLQIGSQLKYDFQVIATTRDILNVVISDLNLTMSYESLENRITVSNPDNSRILQLTVTDTDPQRAADIANDLAEVLTKWIAESMNSVSPYIVDHAVVSDSPVSPSVKRNTVLGAAGAFLVCAAVLVVIFLLDDTIKTEEDVEKYLNVNVLAVIPVDPNSSGQKQKSARKAAKKAKA